MRGEGAGERESGKYGAEGVLGEGGERVGSGIFKEGGTEKYVVLAQRWEARWAYGQCTRQRIERQGFDLRPMYCVVFLAARHFTLMVPLFT